MVVNVTASLRKVFAYDAAGVYQAALDFNLAAANGNPSGITWDGLYFRVVDRIDDKIYTYAAAGVYQSALDFDLASANGNASGITWDGLYFRVGDASDDKVYAYDAQGMYVGNL